MPVSAEVVDTVVDQASAALESGDTEAATQASTALMTALNTDESDEKIDILKGQILAAQHANAVVTKSKQDDCEDIISRRDGALKHNCCKV